MSKRGRTPHMYIYTCTSIYVYVHTYIHTNMYVFSGKSTSGLQRQSGAGRHKYIYIYSYINTHIYVYSGKATSGRQRQSRSGCHRAMAQRGQVNASMRGAGRHRLMRRRGRWQRIHRWVSQYVDAIETRELERSSRSGGGSIRRRSSSEGSSR